MTTQPQPTLLALSIDRLVEVLKEAMADDYPPDAIPNIVARTQHLNGELDRILTSRIDAIEENDENERAYEKTAQILVMALNVEAMHNSDPENVQALMAALHVSLIQPIISKGGDAA